MAEALQIIDSHTEGEPTRIIVSGFPELRGATMAEKRDDFRDRFDHLRRGLIKEPRGHDAIVGALLTASPTPEADAGVIFFNDAGYLGMCGHGTIGVAETLRYLGRISGSGVVLETPVGIVRAAFEPQSRAITIRNVPSHRSRVLTSADIEPDAKPFVAEIAYGGNWFFFREVPLAWLEMARLDALVALTKSIRHRLHHAGITGDNGAEIDHIELYARTPNGIKNFVLCPGNAYDRSPCGTGTSAKLACLAASGELAPGDTIEVESITGGRFTGRYELEDEQIIPYITGRAHVTSRMEPIFDPDDRFRYGL